ncbi:MAG: hypothetical protein ACD_75C01270G0004 [uncultured bacterium]|nr:MAG: hypothetical protein ACD_75C01270G0004 [uncultured bacterium]
MNVSRLCRYYYLRLKRLRGSPRFLAGGTAVGVFVSFTPTMPFHTALIVALALLTRTSPLTGIISNWIVCNPLTFLPIYYLTAIIGNHVTPYELNLENVRVAVEFIRTAGDLQKSLTMIGNMGYEALAVMLAGGFCAGLPAAVLSYYGTLPFFRHIQKQRMKKQVLA